MEKKIEELLTKLTLEEKASLLRGADFWHTVAVGRLDIPAVMVSDGPHGLRKQDLEADHLGVNDSIKAVCFPAACATASSFDRELMTELGQTLGKECQAEDVSVLLGPAVNIKRSPLCGRNFEYISEDPYLAGELAAAYINGVQSENVGTSIKHFAANNQEHERMYSDSRVDERTLREIYLPAFETAVKKAMPWTFMCSYNRVNGTYASENSWLLNKVLREEWGFDGLVMSDWGAVSDRVAGVEAGLDLEMPGGNDTNDSRIVEAVNNGTLSEEAVDKAVANVLRMVFRYTENRRSEVFDRASDHEKAVACAERSMVLLKNEGVLPLSDRETIAMIGGFAEKPRFQGGGSSHINVICVDSALEYAAGYGPYIYAKGFPADEDAEDPKLFEQAIATAEKADKIVVFAGLPDVFESEGYDRTHMRLPECQNHLIHKLAGLGKPVIVVLHNGSPVEMPWADEVQGILEAYLAGEGVGRAEMNILYGRANPSGKLAETFPLRLEDNPSYINFPGKNKYVNYAEGIFVGYRYYDKKKMNVLFPFGHGLSYTTFAYDNLRLESTGIAAGDGAIVKVDVRNTGTMAGREIVQLYISDKTDTTIRPDQELKGFANVELQPGETKTVSFSLDYRSFAYYDTEHQNWHAANGVYEIRVGSSSRDILQTVEITLDKSRGLLPKIDKDVMLGELIDNPLTRDYFREKMGDYVRDFAGNQANEDFDEMLKHMVQYLPLRALRSFVPKVKNEDVDRIVSELKEIVK